MENSKDPFRNADLVLKYLRGALNSFEEEAFKNWLNQNEANKAFLKAVQDEAKLKEELDFYASIDNKKNWQGLVEKIHPEPKINKLWPNQTVLKYAAVFLLLSLSFLAVYINHKQPELASKTPTTISDLAEIKPGKDKAILTLADGTELLLNESSENGLLRANHHIKITKQNGRVIYQFIGKPAVGAELEYHTITTPNGGQYQLVLPDGTQVWLNAASSLRFPVDFIKGERKITLTGEGYFEVIKNKEQPFKVIANNTIVEVLGTHFNIKAYGEENSTKTTLLEGSVKVNKANEGVVLKPGFQAVTGKTDKIITSPADLEQTMAWKEGYFQFNNEDFDSIVAQLERWYNIEIIYPSTISSWKFNGAIPRNTNLNQLLQIFELSGSIKFSVEGRRVMVQPK